MKWNHKWNSFVSGGCVAVAICTLHDIADWKTWVGLVFLSAAIGFGNLRPKHKAKP